jgi:hypothetical protein
VITTEEAVMALLRRGVPISLLADLLDPAGPPSREILAVESAPVDVRKAQELADRSFAAEADRQVVDLRSDFSVTDAAC